MPSKWRVNDRGQDLCSYFFPDGKHRKDRAGAQQECLVSDYHGPGMNGPDLQ
jgi:hypothetical protein